MSQREQVDRRSARREREHSIAASVDASETAARGEELKHEMDEILDEIDAVLEENAQEFVEGYIQKGGE